MRIIKLNAIDSTNSFLRQMSLEQTLEDYTVVVTEHQTDGRGQMGSKWQSERGKNLMFSVFKDVLSVDVNAHFYISMVVSLAVLGALRSFQLKNLSIKWPNDILSENLKLSGILIENVIKKGQVKSSVIGIGINVNQATFDNLPKATSMFNITSKNFEIDDVLDAILKELKHFFTILNTNSFNVIKERYEEEMFRIHELSTFKDYQQQIFTGFIQGITHSGHLKVLVKNKEVKLFNLKEVELMY